MGGGFSRALARSGGEAGPGVGGLEVVALPSTLACRGLGGGVPLFLRAWKYWDRKGFLFEERPG